MKHQYNKGDLVRVLKLRIRGNWPDRKVYYVTEDHFYYYVIGCITEVTQSDALSIRVKIPNCHWTNPTWEVEPEDIEPVFTL